MSTTTAPSVGNKPVIAVDDKTLHVAVFENERTKKDGTPFVAKNFSLSRSYKDAAGEWQEQKMSLSQSEVPRFLTILASAYGQLHSTEYNEEDQE